jgi:hypothetical protein
LDVTVALSLADLNAMKLKGVGSARSQSYLTMHMSSTVLSDMTGVAVNAIVNGVDAFSVSGILADGTSPVLSSFDLSINSSEAILRFSEVVKSSLFNASGFVLQRLTTRSWFQTAAKDPIHSALDALSVMWAPMRHVCVRRSKMLSALSARRVPQGRTLMPGARGQQRHLVSAVLTVTVLNALALVQCVPSVQTRWCC